MVEQQKTAIFRLFLNEYFWCAWQESNLRPFPSEGNALSTELQAQEPGLNAGRWLCG